MEKLKNEELTKVNGGGIKFSKIGVLGAVVSFVIGFVSGMTRPLTCSSGK